MINANRVRIYINDTLVAASTTASIDISNSVVEVTSEPTGGFKEIISGLRGGTMSFETLSSVVEVETETEVDLEFEYGDRGISCRGYISSANFQGATDDVLRYSASIDITGEIVEGVSSRIQPLEIITDSGTEDVFFGEEQIFIRT